MSVFVGHRPARLPAARYCTKRRHQERSQRRRLGSNCPACLQRSVTLLGVKRRVRFELVFATVETRSRVTASTLLRFFFVFAEVFAVPVSQLLLLVVELFRTRSNKLRLFSQLAVAESRQSWSVAGLQAGQERVPRRCHPSCSPLQRVRQAATSI